LRKAEGNLVVTTKELADVTAEFASASANCMQTAADHETTVAARNEELGVIAEARRIIAEATGGAVDQSYSFLQISTRSDLKKSEVITVIKNLARKYTLPRSPSSHPASMLSCATEPPVARTCSPRSRARRPVSRRSSSSSTTSPPS